MNRCRRQIVRRGLSLKRFKGISVNAASWVFGPGQEDQATEIFLAALKLMIGDAESAKAEARGYKIVPDWREQLQLRTGGAAVGTAPVPGGARGGSRLRLPY